MAKFLELVIGGSLGTLTRYMLGGAVYSFAGSDFPYGTMAVNLLGCAVMGFLSTLAGEKFLLGSDVRTFLMIGFCGAFTTFSTFIFETNNLIQDGQVARAFVNVVISVVFGFVLFRAGILIAKII
jgi:CrcB protein